MGYKSLTIAISVFAGCAIALFLIGDSIFHPAGRIILEKKSANGQFTALVEEHTGTLAHLDDGKWDDDIYIRNNNFFGSRVRVVNIWGASRADGGAGVDIKWTAPDCLKITYCQASNAPTNATSVLSGISTVRIQFSKRDRDGAGEQKPTSAELNLNNLAVGELQSGKFEDAIAHLETCLQTNPRYALARENLAVAHNNKGMAVSSSSMSEALKEFYTSFYLQQTEICLSNIERIDEYNAQEKVSFKLHRRLSKEAVLASDFTAAYVELELAARMAPYSKLESKLSDLESKIKEPLTLTPSRQLEN